MVNKPKQIGTRAESAVLSIVKLYFPDARREVLHGSADEGDITGCGEFVFEVKAGAQTKQVGDKQLLSWLQEARTEARNAGVRYGILVLQRAGYGATRVHQWWAYLDLQDQAELVGGTYWAESIIPVRLELGALLQMIAERGYVADEPTEQAAFAH